MNKELVEIYKKTIDEIDSKFEQKRKSIESDIELSKQSVVELYENNKFSPNAILDFDKMQLNDETNYSLPYALRIGDLELKGKTATSVRIPAILPFIDANATAFIIDREQNNEDAIQSIFQSIAFRLLLSLPINLCKFHFVDTHKRGSKFNIMKQLPEKIKHNAFIISNNKKFDELIAELNQTVDEIKNNQLTGYDTLEEYNKANSTLPEPYRFVFISDFPHDFSKELSEQFFNLINYQNASNAGIYIFYSIDNTPTDTQYGYGFDISKCLNISTQVSRNSDGKYEIDIKNDDLKLKQLFNERFNTFDIQLHNKLPDNKDVIINAINRKAGNIKQTNISFDGYLENLMQTTYWEESTKLGVKIPVGKQSSKTIFFEFGNGHYFALVGGNPGMGKTVFLHNIICNGSIIYSPKELQFFLMDCKDGVGFQMYKKLPHVKSTSLNNNIDLILNTLQDIQDEIKNRNKLFNEATEKYNILIDRIEDYREKTNKVLPRIVLIIDEFQKLFEGRTFAQKGKAEEILTNLIKQGRSAGIHIIFCTQKYGDVGFDISLVTLRFAFKLKEESDSGKILGAGNAAASKLGGVGDAILNDKGGEYKDNIKFKGANIEKEKIPEYIKFCRNKCAERFPDWDWEQETEIDEINSSNLDLANNQYIMDLLCAGKKVTTKESKIYLGIEYSTSKKPICVNVSNKSAANLILIGNDIQTAMSSLLSANLQLQLQSPANSKFYIVDFLDTDNEFANYYEDFAELFDSNIEYVIKSELEQLVNNIEQELDERIENDNKRKSNADRGKIILTLSNIQAAQKLKKEGYDTSPITQKLMKILKDGSRFGIHFLFYSYSLEGLFDEMFSDQIFDYFENKVCLQGGKLKLHEEYEKYNIKRGYGLVENKEYKLAPFVFYNTFEGNINPETQKKFDYIFSIYNKN